ncbi:hypothetical protein TNCT_262431 [Trichonephila clavata]|uniref:Uncharacterized protein n=1 Tax=Trichonephila clavata TaxID=2740835 RepID=A0A8X6JF41_TRICU|nr:hypothetical protein TNCT_262431 [Trichonephila clavata]
MPFISPWSRNTERAKDLLEYSHPSRMQLIITFLAKIQRRGGGFDISPEDRQTDSAITPSRTLLLPFPEHILQEKS